MELFKIFNELSLDDNRWSYYSNPDFRIRNVWNSEEDASNFIRNYFTLGGKGNLIEYPITKDFLDNNHKSAYRARHIVSTYLIGLWIAEKLDVFYQKEVDFKYLWFLTCLYHDVGSYYENCKNEDLLSKVKLNGLKSLVDELEVSKDDIYITFKKELIDIYLKGKAKERQEIDHGIVGGLLLFDGLDKMFKKSLKLAKEEHGDRFDENDFNVNLHGKAFHLSKRHYEFYKLAADSIIAHNIFFDLLNKLLGTLEIRKHSFKNNELLFILSIADTIEPIKRFGTNAVEMIDIEFIENKRKLVICIDEKHYSKENMNDKAKCYCKSLNGLETWLNVETEIINKNIEIKINL